MPDVKFTVDGKQLTAPAGTLLIDACKTAGIEVPAFCYYPGLSLQAACRMCVVRIEKMPKLQTACTTPVAEGMVVQTETPEIAQARKATLQLLLGNHPLDCPVCDAGRRVRAAGYDLQVRRRRQLLRRTQEPPRRADSGPLSSTSTARVASSVTAACACAAKAWTSSPSASRIAAPPLSSPPTFPPRCRPTILPTSTASSAACASTPAPSVR